MVKMNALVLASLAALGHSFYLPGVIPKSYSYTEKLPISMSSELTADRTHSVNGNGSKVEVHLARETLREYDFCNPEDGFLLEKVKHSSTTGFFSDQIMNSAYQVDLQYARLPTDVAGLQTTDGNLPPQAGVPMCQKLCSKHWDLQKTMRFSTLVQLGYGYRLFLDDLPSATVQDGRTHYEWLIPLGYVIEENKKEPNSSRRPYKPVAIYNHLDIKVKVHPTLKSDYFGSSNPQTFVFDMPGAGPVKIDLPEQELRIVGFEVTPYSVANAWAC